MLTKVHCFFSQYTLKPNNKKCELFPLGSTIIPSSGTWIIWHMYNSTHNCMPICSIQFSWIHLFSFLLPAVPFFLRKWYFGDVQSWCFYIPIIWRLWLLEAHLGQWQSPLYPNRLKAPKSPPAGEGRNVSHTITSQYYCRVHDTVLLLAIFSRQNFQDPPSGVRSSV